MKLRSNCAVAAVLFVFGSVAYAQTPLAVAQPRPSCDGRRLTCTADFDGGYRKTQFQAPSYNTGIFQWDSRLELWSSRFHNKRRGGPYLRVAGIVGSEPNAFQNGWVARPGIGLQAYLLKGRILGPTRVFGEYNFSDYWGEDFPGQGTSWRPKNQVRAGFDYWKAKYVNSTVDNWWMELWNGLYWQSANEFTDRYNSVLLANSLRLGFRKGKDVAISSLTPYIAIESAVSKYRRTGTKGCPLKPDASSKDPQNPCDFFWENRLLGGGGLRFAPSAGRFPGGDKGFLTRFVVYAEYLTTPTYYGPVPPSSIPRFDVLVGVSADIGRWWYKDE